jgi:hypothetical protein
VYIFLLLTEINTIEKLLVKAVTLVFLINIFCIVKNSQEYPDFLISTRVARVTWVTLIASIIPEVSSEYYY